jgi:hypothetical protein
MIDASVTSMSGFKNISKLFLQLGFKSYWIVTRGAAFPNSLLKFGD